MTPRETAMAIEAFAWRDKRREQADLSLAWHMAAWSRAKRMPSLKRALASTKTAAAAKPLKGKELEQRRQEYDEATSDLDVSVLAKRLQQKQAARNKL